ncbi:MAG: DUF5895 domain-containing protein [Candidatus Nanopelagicaceae bacterium]
MRSGTLHGLAKMATLQVLNKQTRGLFLKDSELLAAGWTATAKDFDKGTVKFGHTHKFGMKATNPETGILFISPKICILIQSPVLVEDTWNGNVLIGELDNPQIKELWDADKEQQQQKLNQGVPLESAKRQYCARTKSMLYILTKDGNIAHTNPLVLSCKNLNSVELFSKGSGYGKFIEEISHSQAARDGLPITAVKYNPEFYQQFVWQPVFDMGERGPNANEICAIVSQPSPTPETLETFAVNEQVMEFFEGLMTVPGILDFHLTHAQKEAKLLGGRYGVAPGYLAGSGEAVLLEESVSAPPALNPGNDADEFLN